MRGVLLHLYKKITCLPPPQLADWRGNIGDLGGNYKNDKNLGRG